SMNTLEFQVVGTFQTFSKDYDARAIRIPLEAVQSLVDATGANVAVLELLDTASTHAVALDLQSLYASEGFELYRWDELDPFYDQTVTLYQQQFGFLIAVILLLIVLGVGTAISMSVYERGAEFGTLRALGTHDGSIGMLILLESLYLGTVGASVGVLIGNLLALLISSIGIPMPPPPNSDLSYVALIRSSFLVSLAAFTVGAIAPFLAALAPVRRSLRLSIVAALQRGI
ncbi:MAG: FtsX-like permease family protein, partial [Planctomycetota bacterium]